MSEYFIARQPILDRSLDLYAYELLFRSARSAGVPTQFDDDQATADVLTTSEEVGLAQLVGGRLAFINLPQKFLLEPHLLPAPRKDVVFEILEHVQMTPEVIRGIASLAERGYTLALDDFVYDARFDEVLQHVSIVKLEIPRIAPADWVSEIHRLKDRGIRVLAEKVETAEEFDQLSELGCDLFQGFFFAKPRMVSGKRLVPSKLTMLKLMSTINKPDTDVEELGQLVSQDVALSVRVVNYVNSAANALSRRIESVQEAVVYAGRDTIRRWVTLILMAKVNDKPNEVLTLALTRARFLQLFAKESHRDDDDSYFTVGLFSLLDALMDMPMKTVLSSMTLPDEIQTALELRSGPRGGALELSIALERGQQPAEELLNGVPGERVAELQLQASAWADDTLSDIAGRPSRNSRAAA